MGPWEALVHKGMNAHFTNSMPIGAAPERGGFTRTYPPC